MTDRRARTIGFVFIAVSALCIVGAFMANGLMTIVLWLAAIVTHTCAGSFFQVDADIRRAQGRSMNSQSQRADRYSANHRTLDQRSARNQRSIQ